MSASERLQNHALGRAANGTAPGVQILSVIPSFFICIGNKSTEPRQVTATRDMQLFFKL
jgi:hypothetical protein